MINPKVSVIIPVFNDQNYIKECIDSVLHQTMQDFEIICIDDGSTDDSGIILKRYAEQDNRIKVLSQTNKGLSVARNSGISIARGEYLYFLDSDDFIELDTLEVACQELDNKHLDVVFFDTYAFGEEGISQDFVNEKNKYIVRNSEYPAIYTGEELLLKLLENHDYNSPVWMQMVRRAFQQKHNLCFYSGIIHEDELYTVQLMMLAKRTAYIHRTLHHRRVRKNSIMTKPLGFESVYGYFICVKEAYRFLIQQGCNQKLLDQLLLLLRSKIVTARNQFIKLTDKEQREYEGLSRQDIFLFQLCILDYVNSIKQQEKIVENNNTLLREKESLNNKLSEAQKKIEQIRKYETARIDIKNFGSWENNIVINYCTDETARIQSPGWLNNEHGSGVVIHSAKKGLDFEIQCCGCGELKLDFRGMDCRDKDGKRYPVWINLTSLIVNEETISNTSRLICHDSPFKYSMSVTNGQVVKVHLEWQEAQDLLAKERDIQLKMIEQTQQKVIKLEKEKSKVVEKLEKTQRKAIKLDGEILNIKNGWSFKIGRIITWIPRRIKCFLKS